MHVVDLIRNRNRGDMLERRSIWAILIGLTICISIWRISIQEPSMLAAEYGYNNFAGGGGGIIIDGDDVFETLDNAPPKNAFSEQETHGAKRLFARKINSKPDLNESFGTDAETADSNSKRKFKFDKSSQSNTDEIKDNDYDVVNATKISSFNVSKTSYSLKNSGKYNRKVNKTLIEFQRDAVLAVPPPVIIVKSSRNVSDHATTLTPSIEAAITLVATTTKRSIVVDDNHQQQQYSQSLPTDDFQQLIDLQNFDYIMRQPDCDRNIFAPILVHSAPANFQKRQLIRMTWASNITMSQDMPTLRVIFLLGAVANATLQRQLQQENSLYSDMVQGNFMDDYKNMTYKHVMAFKWFIYSCANAQLLIKVDDDVFVNTPQLLAYINDTHRRVGINKVIRRNLYAINHSSDKFQLSQQLPYHPKNLLFCQQVLDARVKRSYRSKWRVSVREFAGSLYPPYCPGYSIIYSPDVVQRLYSAAQNTKYFWIDDVHVTGTLVQQLNIITTSSLPYVLSKEDCENVLAGKIELADLEFVFAWPDITAQQITQLWQLIKGGNKPTRNTIIDSTDESYLNEGFR